MQIPLSLNEFDSNDMPLSVLFFSILTFFFSCIQLIYLFNIYVYILLRFFLLDEADEKLIKASRKHSGPFKGGSGSTNQMKLMKGDRFDREKEHIWGRRPLLLFLARQGGLCKIPSLHQRQQSCQKPSSIHASIATQGGRRRRGVMVLQCTTYQLQGAIFCFFKSMCTQVAQGHKFKGRQCM